MYGFYIYIKCMYQSQSIFRCIYIYTYGYTWWWSFHFNSNHRDMSFSGFQGELSFSTPEKDEFAMSLTQLPSGWGQRKGQLHSQRFKSSWWLNQPLWKICSSRWVHLPQVLGWKYFKYLKYKNVIILEKERIVSQPSLFRCDMLSFKGIYLGLFRFPVIVTTRIITCLGSGIAKYLHVPLLLGRGAIQRISVCKYSYLHTKGVHHVEVAIWRTLNRLCFVT